MQIGLGLYLYNNVRSKKIIDLLYNMGFSCSYKDIRSITTSLAKQGLSVQKNVYVPYVLEPINEIIQNYIHTALIILILTKKLLMVKMLLRLFLLELLQLSGSNCSL